MKLAIKNYPKLRVRLLHLRLPLNFNSLLKREVIIVNLAIAGLALLFLSGPLLKFPVSFFSPTDMLQGSPIFAVNNTSPNPHNYVLGDDIYAYLPWIDFSWRNLRQGVFPLWNHYNGAGQL